MSRSIELAVEYLRPERCATCPRRSWAGKILAAKILGEDYVAEGCDPATIVKDGDLKNHLFTEGVVPRPYGVVSTPIYGLGSVSRMSVNSPSFPHPRTSAVSISIGLSDRICPQDVPDTYSGDFEAFIRNAKNSPTDI